MFKELLQEQASRLGTDFRVPHFSIQKDHLHLIVEAENGALTRGIRSFVIVFARRINRLLHRRGNVWGDRYHRRDLTSPRQIKNALGYVLNNDLKHGHRQASVPTLEVSSIDVFSSAFLLDGWCTRTMKVRYAVPWTENMRPRTWGLREGWKVHGLLDPRRKPGAR